MSARINRILNYFVKGVYTYFTHVFTKKNIIKVLHVDFGALRFVEYGTNELQSERRGY